jgi:hypothetical protein
LERNLLTKRTGPAQLTVFVCRNVQDKIVLRNRKSRIDRIVFRIKLIGPVYN